MAHAAAEHLDVAPLYRAYDSVKGPLRVQNDGREDLLVMSALDYETGAAELSEADRVSLRAGAQQAARGEGTAAAEVLSCIRESYGV